MICQRDLTEPPLLGITIDPFSIFGNAMPHEDIIRLYPLLKMVTGRERVERHTRVERHENVNLWMIIDDPKEQFLHIPPDPSPLACRLEALPINP
jgi:hypothetical protein